MSRAADDEMRAEARQPDSEAPSPALAEAMTRLADGPRSKWHDEVLPNGAGESWVCVPIGDVLAALPPSAPPALDVERRGNRNYLAPCQADEQCYRSDGHEGEHAYARLASQPGEYWTTEEPGS